MNKETIIKFLKENYQGIAFVLIVWGIGFSFFFYVLPFLNLCKTENIENIHLLLFYTSLVLILLPFMKTIKLGKILEIERHIKETKNEVTEFKTEMRDTVNMISASVTAVNSLNNQININLPGVQELKEEIEKLKAEAKTEDGETVETIVEQLLTADEGDYVMALARTRIEIEKQLREKLGRRISIEEAKKTDIKFWGLNSLFNFYLDKNPNFKEFYRPFKYVQQICNAAVHGQRVSREQAEEALQLGAMIIRELKLSD